MRRPYTLIAVGIALAVLVAYGVWKQLEVRPLPRAKFPATQIVVGNSGLFFNNQESYLTTYPGSADGNVSPSREIPVEFPSALAMDRSGNIFVASASATLNRVQVYSNPNSGTPQLLRTIEGPSTQISVPTGLAVDSAGNLYVANYGWPNDPSSILKFAPNATGDVSPIATIPATIRPDGSATGVVNTLLRSSGGIAVDGFDRLLVVDAYANASSSPPVYGGLLIFEKNASGDVAPKEAIANSDATLRPRSVAVGSDGRVYLAMDQLNAGDRIVVYPPSPSSSTQPLHFFESAVLEQIRFIAVDGADQVYVPVYGQGSPPRENRLFVFDGTASGTVSPLRTVAGQYTRLDGPRAIVVRGLVLLQD